MRFLGKLIGALLENAIGSILGGVAAAAIMVLGVGEFPFWALLVAIAVGVLLGAGLWWVYANVVRSRLD